MGTTNNENKILPISAMHTGESKRARVTLPFQYIYVCNIQMAGPTTVSAIWHFFSCEMLISISIIDLFVSAFVRSGRAHR